VSRFLLVNEATGAIVSTISAVSEAVALLHAGSGQAVLAMTQDRGGFINDATMKVEDGSLVTIEGGTTPAQFSDLILQEVSSPE
jgi:hypothetical protein